MRGTESVYTTSEAHVSETSHSCGARPPSWASRSRPNSLTLHSQFLSRREALKRRCERNEATS